MNMQQMHKRLGEILADNQKRGWQDRNEMEVAVEVVTYGKKRLNGRRSYKSRFVKIESISSAMMTVPAETGGLDQNYGTTIKIVETKD